jgi:hypothetical protein
MPQMSDPQFALVAAGSSGFNTLVAAVAGKKIRVESVFLSTANTVSYRFFSGTTTGLTGTLLGAANGYYAAPSSLNGHFETAAGAALTGSLSTAVNVQGHMVYRLVGTL